MEDQFAAGSGVNSVSGVQPTVYTNWVLCIKGMGWPGIARLIIHCCARKFIMSVNIGCSIIIIITIFSSYCIV